MVYHGLESDWNQSVAFLFSAILTILLVVIITIVTVIIITVFCFSQLGSLIR